MCIFSPTSLLNSRLIFLLPLDTLTSLSNIHSNFTSKLNSPLSPHPKIIQFDNFKIDNIAKFGKLVIQQIDWQLSNKFTSTNSIKEVTTNNI